MAISPADMRSLVQRCYDCYRTADRAEIESLLHPDFVFTSPYDDHIDRAAYFARCWPAAGSFDHHRIVQFTPAGEGCLVLYEAASKDGKRFRNVESFTFADGRIRSVEVFFGRPPGEPVQ